MASPVVVVFTCNWEAYHGLETAGAGQYQYPAAIRPLKVMCLGQISPGIILKAFEMGAAGVLMLGCPVGECHYEFGNRRAEEVFAEARSLVSMLGIDDNRLRMEWIPAGEGEAFTGKVQEFIERLDGSQAK